MSKVVWQEKHQPGVGGYSGRKISKREEKNDVSERTQKIIKDAGRKKKKERKW